MANSGTARATGDLLTVASGVARMNYFYGQLLTQRDLFTEQRYHLELRRLLQREAFGTGTVAGLRVEDAGATTAGAVFVRAGLALDPDGRELLLVHDQCVTVADALLPSAIGAQNVKTTPFTPANLASDISATWNATIDASDIVSADDPGSLWNRLKAAGLTEVGTGPDGSGAYPGLAAVLNQISVSSPPPVLKPGQLLRDFLFDALVGTTHLGLQYVERGTDPSPTVLDASCCGNATCFPSRREEGVVIVAHHHPFHPLPDPYGHALDTLSERLAREENPATSTPDPDEKSLCERALCHLILDGWRGLPPEDACNTAHLPVVPIAVVYWSRYARGTGGLSRVLSVDNCSRPFAPGVPQVRALLDAILQCTPLEPTAPRFERFSPHDHTQITVTNTATVAVRATSLLVTPIPPTSWEVYYYPPSPTPPSTPTSLPPPAHWNSASTLPATGFPFTIGVTSQSLPSSTNQRFTEVQIVFTSSPSANNFLPSGTYRWRLNIDPANPIQSLMTHAAVEGILEGVFYVP